MLRVQSRLPKPVPDKVLKTLPLGKGNYAKNWVNTGCDAEYTASGTIKGVTHISDSNFTSTAPLSISIDGVTHVRIRAHVSKATTVEVFYVTKSGPNFTQNQSFGVTLTPENSEAICTLRAQPHLDEPITALRIDPSNTTDTEFELLGIDLMKDTKKPEFLLDGVPQPINFGCEERDGYTLFPFNPYHVLVYKLGLYYEYIASENKLSFFSDKASIVFTLGSRRSVVNGEQRLLPIPVECKDGLPMLPLELMSEVFGFKFKYKAPKLSITTK